MEIQLTLVQAIERAYQAMRKGNIKLAFEIAYQLHNVMPEHVGVLTLLGLLHSSQGKKHAELCLQFLHKAQKKGAESIDINLALARAYINKDLIEQAHRELDRAQRQDKPLPIIDLLRAQCFVWEQKWEPASRIFEALKQIKSLEQMALGGLGVIASCQGDFEKALTQFDSLSLAGKTIFEGHFYVFQRHFRDALANLKPHSYSHKILTLRHPNRNPDFYQVFLDWVQNNYPRYLSLFELRLLPCQPSEVNQYSLHIPWFQDPVQEWSETAYLQACQIEGRFNQHGTKVINPVSRLHHAGKYEGALRIASAGLGVPKMVKLHDFEGFKRERGLAFPFFIREDWGHGGQFLRIETVTELEQVNIKGFKRPIAVEIIDVQSSDGLYRKYRYCAIGPYGISHHQLTTDHWVTRGGDRIYTEEIKNEELAFIALANPHHGLFQKAKEALELDCVAFDYGYDQNGEVIVWEANPYPYIRWPGLKGGSNFRVAALHRTVATMLLFYLEQAGISPPLELELLATYQAEAEPILNQFKRPQEKHAKFT